MGDSLDKIHMALCACFRRPDEPRLSVLESAMVEHLTTTRSLACLDVLVQVADSPADFAFASNDGAVVEPDAQLLREVADKLFDAAAALDAQEATAHD